MNYKQCSPSSEEIKKWISNKSINPRTGRKIMENGPTYNLLKKHCELKKNSLDPETYENCTKINVKDFQKCLINLEPTILEEILNIQDDIAIKLPQPKSKPKSKKICMGIDLDNIKPKIDKKIKKTCMYNDEPDSDSDSDSDSDYNTTNNYESFRKNQIDPFTYQKVDSKTAFVFPYKWNSYSGIRTNELDENGPLYFDPDNLIHFYYSSRLNNLWIFESEDNDGYYHGHYGDAIGIAPEFEIKSRGKHSEWYLFRLPIIDCYLDKEHNDQYITMGPLLTKDEIITIHKLANRNKYNYKKRHNKSRPSLLTLKNLYDIAVCKEPDLGFEKYLEQHLDKDDLIARRCKANLDAVDLLVNLT